MRRSRVAATACLAVLVGALWVRGDIAHADGGKAGAPQTASCKVAVVSPVSGNAECVEPPGAPVDAPPPRPPPDKETCLRHRDLGLKACEPTSSDAPTSGESESAAPQK